MVPELHRPRRAFCRRGSRPIRIAESEAIAIGFEQQDNFDYAKKTLGKLKDFFAIDYDIVFGGIADKKIATQKLDGLNFMAARSRPPSFSIARGEVRQIFTGYTGTITGEVL